MDDIGDYIAMGIIVLIPIALFLLICWGVGNISCSAHANAMNFNHKYSFMTGCYVEYEPQKWIGLKNYKVIKTN